MKIPIISRFMKARDKPTNYYTESDYLFGPTTSGKHVNEFTAMQTTAVYACVRILSEAVASLFHFMFTAIKETVKKGFMSIAKKLWELLMEKHMNFN